MVKEKKEGKLKDNNKDNQVKVIYGKENLQEIITNILEEKFNEIIKGDQLTLVDFYATWCGPCKMMHPVLEQLKHDLGDNIRILKLDVDKTEALAMQYRIQSVPTLMLFRGGENIWRQSGAMRLDELKDVIKKYSNI